MNQSYQSEGSKDELPTKQGNINTSFKLDLTNNNKNE